MARQRWWPASLIIFLSAMVLTTNVVFGLEAGCGEEYLSVSDQLCLNHPLMEIEVALFGCEISGNSAARISALSI